MRKERRKPIMEIAELRRGDEVEFFDRLVEGQAYDPWTAQVYPTRPVNLHAGIVLKVTEQNGVLLALPGKRKHWVPLNRIWTKTGMADFVPNHRSLRWSLEDRVSPQREERKLRRVRIGTRTRWRLGLGGD